MKSLLALFISVTGFSVFAADTTAGPDPDTALRELLAGNKRYVADKASRPHQSSARRTEVAKGQHPSAIILGCADSRVPPEVIFDAGLGDLFVVRVAGNIATDEALGSIEYAVEHLGARLIVVLGHERCGAVDAAVKGGAAEGHVGKLIEAIVPAVKQTKGQPGDAVENAMRANVLRMAGLVQKDEPLAKPTSKVKVVGARYDLDTGAVELLK